MSETCFFFLSFLREKENKDVAMIDEKRIVFIYFYDVFMYVLRRLRSYCVYCILFSLMADFEEEENEEN